MYNSLLVDPTQVTKTRQESFTSLAFIEYHNFFYYEVEEKTHTQCYTVLGCLEKKQGTCTCLH